MTRYADAENTGAPLVPLLIDHGGRDDGHGELIGGEVVWRLESD
ncbi:hypothetical protein SAMN05216388_101974 [Halorientalis persicus]|jgi:hypothetical protein|uniref:Uncharacterized protein n=1 Tax=Halorientalis persicus TaxID=1367881 RepID=A0A1H8SKG4_9EURY|nr:hypothetical protein [Halorientalis persicus]SEO79260.1 hypothetical protein SAMN05216388_101974 [Halorientalis persicus]